MRTNKNSKFTVLSITKLLDAFENNKALPVQGNSLVYMRAKLISHLKIVKYDKLLIHLNEANGNKNVFAFYQLSLYIFPSYVMNKNVTAQNYSHLMY